MGLSANVVWRDGLCFNSLIRNHNVIIDAPSGKNEGPSPKELTLVGIAGCSAMDVQSLMAKMRVPSEKFNVQIDCDLTEGHPSIFSNIKLVYNVESKEEIDPEKIKKAVHMSMSKYCGVSAMIAESADITYDIVINGNKVYSGTTDF